MLQQYGRGLVAERKEGRRARHNGSSPCFRTTTCAAADLTLPTHRVVSAGYLLLVLESVYLLCSLRIMFFGFGRLSPPTTASCSEP
jgi:hypothetical protein